MNDSKLINFFLLLSKNKKAIIIISSVIVILTMIYFIFFYGTYTSSCMLSIKFNEHFLAETSVSNDSIIYDKPQFKSGMLDDEALSYIESIKIEKSMSGRINPYKENLTNMNEYYMDYIFEQKFFDYLSENGINPNSIAIENIADDISIRTFSKKKGKSYEIMLKLQELIPQYVGMKTQEMITDTKACHEAWIENDRLKLTELINKYKSVADSNDMETLESRRKILNEYAAVAADYDISYSVIKTSDDLLSADISPKAFVRAVNKDGNDKLILFFVYFFVSIIFAFAVSTIYVYIKDFAMQVKKVVKEAK